MDPFISLITVRNTFKAAPKSFLPPVAPKGELLESSSELPEAPLQWISIPPADLARFGSLANPFSALPNVFFADSGGLLMAGLDFNFGITPYPGSYIAPQMAPMPQEIQTAVREPQYGYHYLVRGQSLTGVVQYLQYRFPWSHGIINGDVETTTLDMTKTELYIGDELEKFLLEREVTGVDLHFSNQLSWYDLKIITNFLTAGGNFVASVQWPFTNQTKSWLYFLSVRFEHLYLIKPFNRQDYWLVALNYEPGLLPETEVLYRLPNAFRQWLDQINKIWQDDYQEFKARINRLKIGQKLLLPLYNFYNIGIYLHLPS